MYPILKFGSIQIATFFVVISLSLSLLILLFSKKVEQNSKKSELNPKDGFDLLIIILIAGFLGGRLFHVFYEEWIYYQSYPSEIFKFWNGGFVYFGGALTALVSAALFTFIKKISFWSWADFFTPFLSAGYALGRVGCFLEGCCFGRITSLPWAIEGRHPTQVYMILAEVILLIFILKKEHNFIAAPGKLFITWALAHALCRFVIEFYRDDGRGAFLLNLSISQWISLVIATICVFYIKKLKLFFK